MQKVLHQMYHGEGMGKMIIKYPLGINSKKYIQNGDGSLFCDNFSLNQLPYAAKRWSYHMITFQQAVVLCNKGRMYTIYDSVDITNLPRQILFNTEDLGKNKAETAINCSIKF